MGGARGLAVAAAQPACVPYDVAANAQAHADVVRVADARVVVFPELSLTGYELDAPSVALDDPRLRPLVEVCRETGTVALVGAPVRGERGDHLAMLSIDGAEVRVAYRKMWLSDLESARFTAGDAPSVIEVDGWRLGLAICKDTGVQEHAARTAALGIDVYVAGVLDSADDASIQEERARRIVADHHVWAVVASFAGSAGGGYEHAAARSRIWSPDGDVVAEASGLPGGLARAVLAPRPGAA